MTQTLATQTSTELYIDGRWRPGADGERIEVRDPATGDVFDTVASAGVEDALEAVAAADAARPGWAGWAPRARAELLRGAFELMIERTEELAELIVRENGKALTDARGEVIYAAEFFRWFSEEAVRVTGSMSTAPAGGRRIMVTHPPIGVALLVTPWNFPAAMATRKIAPAFAAGCPVVLKPASAAPLTALAIAELFAELGLPRGVLNVIPSQRSSAVVSAMLVDDRVRKLSFTGSTHVGRILLAQAAQKVVHSSMELGGNAPFLVFADADLDDAVAGALVAKMRSGGETCVAANRFYVQGPVVEEFTARLTAAMGSLRVGPGLQPDTQVGAIVDRSSRDAIGALVDGAVAEGAEVRLGGRVPKGPGWFYPPTVLADVAADSSILSEEIFGPVAPVVAFDHEEEAVALANGTPFGLISYVYSRDLARGLRVAEALETGMVGVNHGLVSDPAAPFGGMKQSGMGREGAHDGLLEFCETKYIAVTW